MNKEDKLLDDLFKGENKNISEQTILPTAKLQPNFNNPYKIRDDEMKPLEESISAYGVLEPLLVRKDDKADVYTVVSGHRRLLAATRLGLETLPVRVLDVTADEANIMMVDSNLHREEILPSEKAHAYKLKMDALSHQGKSCQLGTKSRSDEQIAENSDDSARQIQRFVRLINLIPELLKMVDDKKIGLTPAVELSYLTREEQQQLLQTIESEEVTPSTSQAKSLRKSSQDGTLTQADIFGIMTAPKANQREVVKIQVDKYAKYFDGLVTAEEREKYIASAMEFYAKHLARQHKRSEPDWER